MYLTKTSQLSDILLALQGSWNSTEGKVDLGHVSISLQKDGSFVGVKPVTPAIILKEGSVSCHFIARNERYTVEKGAYLLIIDIK